MKQDSSQADRTTALFSPSVFATASITGGDFVLTLKNGATRELSRRINGVEFSLQDYQRMIQDEVPRGPVECTTYEGRKWLARFWWKRTPSAADIHFIDGGCLRVVPLVRHPDADPAFGDAYEDRFGFEFPALGAQIPKRLCGRTFSLTEVKEIVNPKGDGLRCVGGTLIGRNGKKFDAILKYTRSGRRIEFTFINGLRSSKSPAADVTSV